LSKPRALILGFPIEFQIKAVLDSNVEPVYWFCNKTKDTHLIKSKSIWHDAISAVDLKTYPAELDWNDEKKLSQKFFENNKSFSYDIIKSYFDRCDLYDKNITFNETRRLLYRDTSFWHYVFDKLKIEIVICDNYPHVPHDLIAFNLAILRKIPTFFLYQLAEDVHDPYRFLISDSLENTFGKIFIDKKRTLNSCEQIRSDFNLKDFEQEGGYSLSMSVFNSKRTFMSQIKVGKILKGISHPKKLINYISVKFRKYFRKNFYLHLLNKLQITFYQTSLPSDKNIIYFPLSVQPEYQSGPMARNYDDLFFAIKTLSDSVPEDWIIAVKEHPYNYQVEPRVKGYFSAISNLRNVIIIPTSLRNSDIFKEAKIVAHIGSTSGWEALIAGLSVIVFGQIWYEECKGVVHWNDVRDPTKYFSNYEAAKPKDLIGHLNWLRKNSYQGIIQHHFLNEGLRSLNITASENSRMLKVAINDYIESNILEH